MLVRNPFCPPYNNHCDYYLEYTTFTYKLPCAILQLAGPLFCSSIMRHLVRTKAQEVKRRNSVPLTLKLTSLLSKKVKPKNFHRHCLNKLGKCCWYETKHHSINQKISPAAPSELGFRSHPSGLPGSLTMV